MTTKTHVSFKVRDLSKSLEFYETFFGAPPHKVRSGYANFDLESPSLKLALSEHTCSAGRGKLSHLGIVMDSQNEVAEARTRLREVRLLSYNEGKTDCCHAQQDKFWVKDPDGVLWEVYSILNDQLLGAENGEQEDQRTPLQRTESSCAINVLKDKVTRAWCGMKRAHKLCC